MDCEKLDWLLMGLVFAFTIALAITYMIVVPATFVLYGMAAQCVVSDPCGKSLAFIASMLMSAFIGYSIANLVNNCEDKEESS